MRRSFYLHQQHYIHLNFPTLSCHDFNHVLPTPTNQQNHEAHYYFGLDIESCVSRRRKQNWICRLHETSSMRNQRHDLRRTFLCCIDKRRVRLQWPKPATCWCLSRLNGIQYYNSGPLRQGPRLYQRLPSQGRQTSLHRFPQRSR